MEASRRQWEQRLYPLRDGRALGGARDDVGTVQPLLRDHVGAEELCDASNRLFQFLDLCCSALESDGLRHKASAGIRRHLSQI